MMLRYVGTTPFLVLKRSPRFHLPSDKTASFYLPRFYANVGASANDYTEKPGQSGFAS
jgi:hypothetical protein